VNKGPGWKAFSGILDPILIPEQQKVLMTMPETKNNKNDPIDPTRPAKKETGDGALPGTERERWKAADALQELTQSKERPAPPTSYNDWDVEMALDFLGRYHDMGQALIRAGFIKAGPTPGTQLPNWEQFALHIEEQFDPKSDEMLDAAVAYLYWHQENLDRRNTRIDNAAPWETYDVDNDMVWLAESIQQVGHRLSEEINHMDRQPCDGTQVSAVLFVLMVWAEIDPEVAHWLANPGTLM
jgi:hypothetical protein